MMQIVTPEGGYLIWETLTFSEKKQVVALWRKAQPHPMRIKGCDEFTSEKDYVIVNVTKPAKEYGG